MDEKIKNETDEGIRVNKSASRRDGSKSGMTILIRASVSFVFSITVLLSLSCLLIQYHSKASLNKPIVLSTGFLRRQRTTTVYFLPGPENNCGRQYDYLCRLWFHVRCIVLAHVKNLVVVPDEQGGMEKVLKIIQPYDIIIFVGRSDNGNNSHNMIPGHLKYIWELQKKNISSIYSQIRVGMYHIAPELGRTNWPWYRHYHFIIRNFWVSDHLPPHIVTVPIGAQYPNVCAPAFLPDSFQKSLPRGPCKNTKPRLSIFGKRAPKDASTVSQHVTECSCGSSQLTPPKERPFLWSFTGSLRRNRWVLPKLLEQNKEIKDLGFIHIVSRFGGDGTFGSRGSDNPKTLHLNVISKSIFVFAPCGNVMETHRIYEAIILGAIPVIENCEPEWSGFFPFKAIIVNGGPKGLVDFVAYYKDRMDEVEKLQKELLRWWRLYTNELARNVSNVVYKNVPQHLRTSI